MTNLAYPKIRGPHLSTIISTTNTAAKLPSKKEIILTDLPNNDRPQGQREDSKNSQNKFLTIKEVATLMRVSEWTVYSIIKTDRSFPFLNIGAKKKFVVDQTRLAEWMNDRTNERSLA
jgi:predicted DNA-binding transcriptional regulator AlpA